MKNHIVALSLVTGLTLAAASAAQADLIALTYEGASATATGVIDITGGVAVNGSVTITGTVGMDGVYTLLSGSGISPAGAFSFDSLLDLNAPQHLTSAGLLFVNGSGQEINIWGNAVSNYSLYGWGGGYSPADDGGNLIVQTIPGPGALATAALGLMVSGARRRRR